MTDRNIRINIDPTGARTGAQRVVKSLEDIRATASKTGKTSATATDGFTKSVKRGASAVDEAKAAVKGYGQTATEAARSVAMGTAAQGKHSKAVQAATKSIRSQAGEFRSLAAAASGFFGVLGATSVVRSMVSQFSAFEKTMSEVQAVTRSTEAQMVRLSKTARQLGADTQFSASQAAEGMAFLGRAGFTTNQIVATIGDTLNLAAAGALDLGTAADIASNVLTGFNMNASEMGRVSDVIALTAAKANTSVEQMGQAMKFAAPVAASMGVSIEKSSAAIGALSDAGLQAEMAGTGLRMALISLADPTEKARDALARLGLSAADVNPMTNDLATVLTRLRDAGIETTDAMQIAGARGGTALTVLAASADKVTGLTDTLNAAEGAAKRMAETMTNNLSGSLTRLGSKMSEFNLKIMEGRDGIGALIRGGVDLLVNNFDRVESGLLAAAAAVGVLTTGFVALNATMLLNPFVAVGVAIAGVTFALLEAERQTGIVSRTWHDFTTSAAAAWGVFTGLVDTAWNETTDGIAGGVNLAIAAFEAMVNTGIDVYNGLVNGFFEPVLRFFYELPGVIGDQFNEALSEIEGFVNEVLAFVGEDAIEIGRVGGSMGKEYFRTFSEAAHVEFGRFKGEEIRSAIASPIEGAGEIVTAIMADVSKSVSEGVEAYQRLAEKQTDAKNHANEFVSAHKSIEKPVKAATSAVEDLTGETEDETSATTSATEAMEERAKALKAAREATAAAAKASREYIEDLQDEAKAARDSAEATRTQTEIARLMEEDTHSARLAIIGLREAQALAAVDAEIHAQKLELLDEQLSETAEVAIRDYIAALEDQRAAIEGSFDQKRIEEFADENEAAAQRVEEAWSNTTSAIGGFFDDLFGDMFSGLGRAGGLVEGLLTDILGQSTGSSAGSLGGIIGDLVSGGIVDSVTSGGSSIMGGVGGIGDLLSGGIGGLTDVLSSASGVINNFASTFLPGGNLFNLSGVATSIAQSGIGSALGLSTNAAPALSVGGAMGEMSAVGTLTGSGQAFATGLSQLGSIAVAPFLGMGAAAIISAMMRADPPRSAAAIGAQDGRAFVSGVVTENDGDSEIGRGMGQAASDAINQFLDLAGATLLDSAQLGNVGLTDKRFASTVDGGLFGTRASSLGIDSLPEDRRFFDQNEDGARGAIADFVARTLIRQVQDGTLDGIAEGAAETMQIGLGNIARNIEFDGLSEDEFQQVMDDVSFVASFDALAESLREVDITALGVSERAEMAAKSQAAFNAQLNTFRADAAQAVSDSDFSTPLSGLRDFVDQAERIFDPSGGNRFQIRNAIGGGRVDTQFSDLREMSDEGSAGFNVNPFVDDIMSTGRNDDMSDPNLLRILEERIELIDRELGEDGELISAFRREGDTFQARMVELADLLEERGVDFDERFGDVIDEFFVSDRDYVGEAVAIARGQVESFFSQFAEDVSGQIQGPLQVFEEIVPGLSPVVEQFELLKAQVNSTRPDLQALNEDFARLGEELIDIDGYIDDAISAVSTSAQDQFLAGLGIAVSEDGQVEEASVDFAAINSLAEAVAALDQNAAVLFESDERGLYGDVQEAINETLSEGIQSILDGAEDASVTLEQIQMIFGDRLGDLTFAVEDAANALEEQSGADLAQFAKLQLEMAKAEIAARELQIEAIENFVETLEEEAQEMERIASQAGRNVLSLLNAANSLALDQASSFASPLDRLEGARADYLEAVAQANGDPNDDATQQAIQSLPTLSREYQEAAAGYYGNSEEFYDVQSRIQSDLRSIANAQRSIEEQSLSRLTEIRDEIASQTSQLVALQAQQTLPKWVQGADGQYVATGAGDIEAGFDLGRNAEVNSRILKAIRAIGFDVDGFGEDQLGALRRSEAAVDELLNSMGFANGGAFTNGIVMQPTFFDAALMGEDGAEGILPLTSVGGQLGVSAIVPANDGDAELLRENNNLLRQILTVNQAHAADDRETNEVIRSRSDRAARAAILERAS